MTNPRILLIEDEIRSQNLFVACLQAEGYDILIANDGLTGFEIAIEQLLDGYDVLTKLRQNKATAIIPFIFLTAKTSKAELRQGMNLGADDYLTKPMIVEELTEAIEARLKKHNLTDKVSNTSDKNSDKTSNQTSQSFFPSLPHLKEVFSFIEANYNQGITLNDVAQAMGYSSAYLTNLVGKQTGKTINRWIIERRMVAACHLLEETNKPIEAISREIGYQDACHFSRQFRKYWKTTPQKWRSASWVALNK
jgi:YesN/AraC family two-component response regulator